MIVFGAEERDKVEAIKDKLTANTGKEYENAATYHDGKWVLLNINNDKVVRDVEMLLEIKRKRKKRQ